MSILPQKRTPDRQLGLDRLQAALRKLLSAGRCASGEEKRPYECDGLSAYRQLPDSWRYPKLSSRFGTSSSPATNTASRRSRAAPGTGLSGGALPHADGVLLSLSKLSRIRIDPIKPHRPRRTRRAHLAISEAAAPYGL